MPIRRLTAGGGLDTSDAPQPQGISQQDRICKRIKAGTKGLLDIQNSR